MSYGSQRSETAETCHENCREGAREVNTNKMQFGFMPGTGTVDAMIIVRRMHEEFQEKDKKLYMHFVDMEKAFGRVTKKVMGVGHGNEGFIRSNGSSSY